MARNDFGGLVQGTLITNAQTKQWMTYYDAYWSSYQWTTNDDTTLPVLKIDGHVEIVLKSQGTLISESQARQKATYESAGWRFGYPWVIQDGETYPELVGYNTFKNGQPMSSQGRVARVKKTLGGKLFYQGYTYGEMYSLSQTTRSYFTPVYDTVDVVHNDWSKETIARKYKDQQILPIYSLPNADSEGVVLGFKTHFINNALETDSKWDKVHHTIGTNDGGASDGTSQPTNLSTFDLEIHKPDDHVKGYTFVTMSLHGVSPTGVMCTWDTIIDNGSTSGRTWGVLIKTSSLIDYLVTSGKTYTIKEKVLNEENTIYEVEYEYAGDTKLDTQPEPDLTLYFLASGVTNPASIGGIKIGSETAHTFSYQTDYATDVTYYYYAPSTSDDVVPIQLYDELMALALPNSVCHIVISKDNVTALKVRIRDGETMYVSLVEMNHVKASPIRVMTPQGVKCLEMLETQDQI